jgi:hypothetical protein
MLNVECCHPELVEGFYEPGSRIALSVCCVALLCCKKAVSHELRATDFLLEAQGAELEALQKMFGTLK